MTICTICTLKRAQEISGKLTIKNKKMPGSAFPTSTEKCGVGSALKLVPGSVCAECYAARAENFRPNVAQGYMKNWVKTETMVNENMDLWCEGIVYQIYHFFKKTNVPFHRWFDSGDLYSVEWLIAIARVARLTPDVMHWLPTKEKAIVLEFKKNHRVPKNLIIRVSSAMIDSEPLKGFKTTSTVHKNKDPHGQQCIAEFQDGHCGDCRACWNPKIKNISYHKH